MNSWTRRLRAIAALAAVFVAVSVAVQAIRQGSWGPVITVGWIPAVIVAAWPGTYRRCLPPRHGQAG
jgi:hypothetical protein